MRILPKVLLVALLLGGCGLLPPGSIRDQTPDDYYDRLRRDRQSIGSLINEDGLLLLGRDRSRRDEGGAGLGVNAFLWRGSLDTLSFMPLVSADPFGGVIITDWYSPPETSGERFKLTVYILGRQLRSDGVRVAVFRQVQARGAWVDVPVSEDVAPQLEDKILARARDLRIQSNPQTAGR